MCCAAQPPQSAEPAAERLGALGRWRSGSRRVRRACPRAHARALAGQRAGNDRAPRRDAAPMRVERDDRKLLERLSHGARQGGILSPRRRRATATGSRREASSPAPRRRRARVAGALERGLAPDPAFDDVRRAGLELRLDEADEPRAVAPRARGHAAGPAAAR